MSRRLVVPSPASRRETPDWVVPIRAASSRWLGGAAIDHETDSAAAQGLARARRLIGRATVRRQTEWMRGKMRTTGFQLTAIDRSVEGLHRPIGHVSPGAAWLEATAARGAEVQRLVAEGHDRDTLLILHAHHATEDPRFDPCRVAADLHVQPCYRAREGGRRFAAEVALFRLARALLQELTSGRTGSRSAA